jgi:hyperosmotically inducible periplasmic protein
VSYTEAAASDSWTAAPLIVAVCGAAYGCFTRRRAGSFLKEHSMNSTIRLTLLASALVASAALTACNKPGQETVGQKVDGSIADIRSATQEIRSDATAAANDAKAASAKAADAVAATAKDIAITAKVNAALAADNSLKAMDINVDTKDGRVSMRGSAPDAAARERAKALAYAVDGVVTVDNQLVVGKKS